MPARFQLYVITTLESQEFMSMGMTSTLTRVLDMGGMRIGDSAFIFEYGYLSPEQGELEVTQKPSRTQIDSESSIVTTNHEVAHLCDEQYFDSTEPQAEAFAVSIQLGLNLEIALKSLGGYDQKARPSITMEEVKLLFSSIPPDYFKVWHIYGLAPAFYCFAFERIGQIRFKSFYKKLTENSGGENNLLVALEAVAAGDLLQDFVVVVNESLQKTVSN